MCSNINGIYSLHCWKVLSVCNIILSPTMRVYLRSFSRCCLPLCEVAQNSEKMWTYSSSRSPKDIDLGANRKCICDFLLVRHPFLRYGDFFAENCVFFLPLSHSAPPLPMFLLEFRGEINHEETESWGYVWWKLHDPNFNRSWLIHQRDRQTDRRTDRRTDGR